MAMIINGKVTFTPRPILASVKYMQKYPVETIAAAVLACGIGVGAAYLHEKKRESCIPIAFSEITQIEKEAAQRNQPVSPMTHFYAHVNDLGMNIWEAWNVAHMKTPTGDSEEKQFQRELTKAWYSKEHNYSLERLLTEYKIKSARATTHLSEFQSAAVQAQSLSPAAHHVMVDSPYDVTHIETTTTTDSKGNSTTTYNIVYDYTIHDWTYNENNAREVRDGIVRLKASTVNSEAIQGTLIVGDSNKHWITTTYTPDELAGKPVKELATQWTKDNRYRTHGLRAAHAVHAVQDDDINYAQNMAAAKKLSRNDLHYINYQHTDSGPAPAQHFDNVADTLDVIVRENEKLQESMQRSDVLAKELEHKVRLLVQVEEGPAGRKEVTDMYDVLRTSQKLYIANFDAENRIHMFRNWFVVLAGAAAACTGAMLGGVWRYFMRRSDLNNEIMDKLGQWGQPSHPFERYDIALRDRMRNTRLGRYEIKDSIR